MALYRNFSALVAVLSSASALAACPVDAWRQDPRIPACPASNSTLLPAQFPNAAFAVSDDQRRYDSPDGMKSAPARVFTETVVLEILKNSGDHVPLILIPGPASTLARVKAAVSQFARKTPAFAAQEQSWLAALAQVNRAPFTWQQDYFKAAYSSVTGNPVIRQDQDYESNVQFVDALAQTATASCPMITKGPDLTSVGGDVNATDGGNMAGLPGGLCLHGDNQLPAYSSQYCGSPDNEVVIPTSWLLLGHVDEISAVVGNPSAPAPCDFAITLASPKLGLDLLRAHAGDKFFHFYADGPYAGTDLGYRAFDTDGSGMACQAVNNLKATTALSSARAKRLATRGKKYVSRSIASVLSPGSGCTTITNGQVAQAYSQGDLGILNSLVQIKMDQARAAIYAKVHARLPQCSVSFIDIPQLFYGGPSVASGNTDPGAPLDARYSLPTDPNSKLVSLLPNGTNTLVVGDVVLSPHPQNDAFAQAMSAAYAGYGIKNVFIDTYDYAHVMGGNLHCSTHSMPICKP